jgi:hypothetical protein
MTMGVQQRESCALFPVETVRVWFLQIWISPCASGFHGNQRVYLSLCPDDNDRYVNERLITPNRLSLQLKANDRLP